MRHCPNPECPFRQRYGRPADFRDGFTHCSDCGTALADGPTLAAEPPVAAAAPRVAAPDGGDAVGRLAVTLIVLVVVAVAQQAPLLGVRWVYKTPADLGLLALGLTPIVSGFQVVEIVALLIPALDARRTGTEAQRRPLTTAAMMLGLLLMVLQAATMVRWAASSEGVLELVPGYPPMLVTLSVPVLLLLGAAWLVEHKGLGSGFAVVLLALGAGPVAGWAKKLGNLTPLELLLTFGLVAGSVWLMLRTTRPLRGPAPVPRWLPVPLSSVLVTVTGGYALAIAHTLGVSYNAFADPALNVFLGVDAALVLGFLFFRPAAVRVLWLKWLPHADGDSVQDAARRALPRALALTGLIVAVTLIAPAALNVLFPGLATLALLVVPADLADEWRARRRLGPLVVVRQLHRFSEVEPALEALRAAGIEAHARGARYRSLLQIFGSYVPISLVVPAVKAAEATAVVDR